MTSTNGQQFSNRNLMLILCAFVFICVNYSDALSFSSRREPKKIFGGYRITPRFCKPTRSPPPGVLGGPSICMFNHECSQRNGYVVGACMDGFLFGTCCQLPAEDVNKINQTSLYQAAINSISNDGGDVDNDVQHDKQDNITTNKGSESKVEQSTIPYSDDGDSDKPTEFNRVGIESMDSTELTESTETTGTPEATTKFKTTSYSYITKNEPDKDLIKSDDMSMELKSSTMSIDNYHNNHNNKTTTFYHATLSDYANSPGDKYVLVPTINHDLFPHEHHNGTEFQSIVNIIQMLDDQSPSKVITSTSQQPSRPSSYTNRPSTPPLITLQTFLQHHNHAQNIPVPNSVIINSQNNEVPVSSKPLSTSYVYSSTISPRPGSTQPIKRPATYSAPSTYSTQQNSAFQSSHQTHSTHQTHQTHSTNPPVQTTNSRPTKKPSAKPLTKPSTKPTRKPIKIVTTTTRKPIKQTTQSKPTVIHTNTIPRPSSHIILTTVFYGNQAAGKPSKSKPTQKPLPQKTTTSKPTTIKRKPATQTQQYATQQSQQQYATQQYSTQQYTRFNDTTTKQTTEAPNVIYTSSPPPTVIVLGPLPSTTPSPSTPVTLVSSTGAPSTAPNPDEGTFDNYFYYGSSVDPVLITPKPNSGNTSPNWYNRPDYENGIYNYGEAPNNHENLIINFPPVRNPNLNLSVPIELEEELTTPLFMEDDIFEDKLDGFVNKIIDSLKDPFNDLREVVNNEKLDNDVVTTTKKPTTTRRPSTTKKPLRLTSPTTTTTTTTRRPTRKPTRKPTTIPPTTRRPITITTTKKPVRKPITTTFEPLVEENYDEAAAEVEDATPDYKRLCGVRPHMKYGRIVGGKGATFGQWPWQVLVREATWLGLFTKNKCGGVLISDRYVITAAHCQAGFLASLVAVFGEYDISSKLESKQAVTRSVKDVIVHGQYNPATFENDLALLRLSSPVEFDTHIVPICLPPDNSDFTGRMATVTGWGRLQYGGSVPSVLQEVQVPVMENSVCQEMFNTAGHPKVIFDSFVCAGYAHGQKDSCEGDSGGPLVLQRPDGRWELAGTVSHGIKCAAPYLPGVYMRTAYYKPWLSVITGLK